MVCRILSEVHALHWVRRAALVSNAAWMELFTVLLCYNMQPHRYSCLATSEASLRRLWSAPHPLQLLHSEASGRPLPTTEETATAEQVAQEYAACSRTACKDWCLTWVRVAPPLPPPPPAFASGSLPHPAPTRFPPGKVRIRPYMCRCCHMWIESVAAGKEHG